MYYWLHKLVNFISLRLQPSRHRRCCIELGYQLSVLFTMYFLFVHCSFQIILSHTLLQYCVWSLVDQTKFQLVSEQASYSGWECSNIFNLFCSNWTNPKKEDLLMDHWFLMILIMIIGRLVWLFYLIPSIIRIGKRSLIMRIFSFLF